MNQVVQQFPDHIMTMQELKEYKQLNAEIFGSDSFVEMDFDNPKHRRLNELSGKFLNLRKYISETQTQKP